MAAGSLPGFIHLASYTRATRDLFTDADQRAIERALVADPEAGDVIRGTGGVRKLRAAVGGRGKRGGARVIYYYRSRIGRIYLITAYPKNVQDDLTPDQRSQMNGLTVLLDGEE